jgi:hypothetical protein
MPKTKFERKINMRKFNMVIVYEDGTSASITNKRAESKTKAIQDELENRGLNDSEKVISITIIERTEA